MKAFVRQDCSARLARARLRQSGPINVEFKSGDLIMYRKDGIQQHFRRPHSWNSDHWLQELMLKEPRALKVKVSPSSQRQNQQLH